MTKKVIAFGASNSSKSINRQLVDWASQQLENVEVELLDLNDFEMPIYSIDREQESGVPELAQRFRSLLQGANGIMISFAEHNGSYTTAFKNIFDWNSRIGRPIWMDKPMFLMATSPGGRGGQNVLSTAKTSFPYQGGKVVASFSLPSFNQNFSLEKGISNAELKTEFDQQLALFNQAI